MFIYQAIREGSLIGQIEGICVGDHIEKVNDISMIGSRHYEVAKTLKEIKRGDQFSLRLIEPIKSGFSEFSAWFLWIHVQCMLALHFDYNGIMLKPEMLIIVNELKFKFIMLK